MRFWRNNFKNMKIGVNARLLTKPFTGIGQYTRNLVKELAKKDAETQYVLVVPHEIPHQLAAEFPKNVEIKVLKEKKFPSAGMRKTWWEQITVPEFFIKEKVDVAFFPYPANPWTNDWYKKGPKTVVTVHDCIPWMNKNYRKGLLSKIYHAQTRKAVAKADLVLTVSGSSKKDIENVCKVDAAKIEVVYNDASPIYKEEPHPTFVNEVLGRYSLKSEKYFLYVGGYDERKNVNHLVGEYLKFSAEHKGIPLVLAGGKLFTNKLYKSFDRLENLGNIVKTGFLSEEELACLYRNSLAFVNLSQHEGFNLTILEAANSGTAMILSDIPVHKEVAENAAMFVENNVVKAMEEMMNEKKRKDWQKKSAVLAKKYSWKKYAQIVKDMLHSL
jgi:glycosyltransferase involved in cell wall biosynthesis